MRQARSVVQAQTMLGPPRPARRALEWLAAALAVAALMVACLAVFTVGRVAYPVTAATGDAGASPDAAGAAARLRAGIRLTIVALILAVLAGLSGWWPSTVAATATAITGTTGQAWCGQLVIGRPVPSACVPPTASSPCAPRPSPRSARWRRARDVWPDPAPGTDAGIWAAGHRRSYVALQRTDRPKNRSTWPSERGRPAKALSRL
jgi:hypothetical protein